MVLSEHSILEHHAAATDRRQHDRARDTGRRHGENEASARAVADTAAQAEHARRAACLQRWPAIVAAIRTLIAAYNEGAGAEVLTASEQPDSDAPAVTVTSRSPGHPITIAVDDDALLVHTKVEPHAAASLHAIARRIDCSRSDTATAAYALQDWMDRL